jgi:hypothetical protein
MEHWNKYFHPPEGGIALSPFRPETEKKQHQ